MVRAKVRGKNPICPSPDEELLDETCAVIIFAFHTPNSLIQKLKKHRKATWSPDFSLGSQDCAPSLCWILEENKTYGEFCGLLETPIMDEYDFYREACACSLSVLGP